MCSSYATGAVALDFESGNGEVLVQKARDLVACDGIYLMHALRMTGCASDLEFSPECLEQEYWRCDTELKQCGERWQIPPARQFLLVGPVVERVADFVADQDIGLVVMGNDRSGSRYPIDVVSGAMRRLSCDLFVVGDSAVAAQ